MDQKERIEKEKKIWNQISYRYDRQNSHLKHAYDLSIEKSKNLINKSDMALEIGCGTGIITLGVADKVENIKAVDISEEMIKVAKSKAKIQKNDNIEFLVADGYNLNFADESFDVVLIFNLLHLIKEPETQIKEAKRVLKKEGILITATDCYKEPVSFGVKWRLILQNILHKFKFLPFVNNYKIKDLKELVNVEGLEIIEEEVLFKEPVNYYIALKKS